MMTSEAYTEYIGKLIDHVIADAAFVGQVRACIAEYKYLLDEYATDSYVLTLLMKYVNLDPQADVEFVDQLKAEPTSPKFSPLIERLLGDSVYRAAVRDCATRYKVLFGPYELETDAYVLTVFVKRINWDALTNQEIGRRAAYKQMNKIIW